MKMCGVFSDGLVVVGLVLVGFSVSHVISMSESARMSEAPRSSLRM